MAVTPYTGAVPNRHSPDTFSVDMDEYLEWFTPNAYQVQIAANIAEAAALSAALEADEWVSAASYTAGDLVWSPVDYVTYRAKTDHSGETTDPSADATNWADILPSGVGGVDWADIGGDIADNAALTSALAGKSDTGHSHEIGDVTNLSSALAGKASASHTHAISGVTGLQGALDAKLSDAPSDGSEYVRKDGAWAVASGGGGGSALSLLKANGNTSAVSLDDVEAAIVWATPVAINTGSDVSVSGSEITINNAGTYDVSVSLRTDNGNRTELFIRTYIDADGASGWTEDTDETMSGYVSRDADQNTGGISLETALTLAAGAKLEFRGFGDTDGTCVMTDAGTRLKIQRIT